MVKYNIDRLTWHQGQQGGFVRLHDVTASYVQCRVYRSSEIHKKNGKEREVKCKKKVKPCLTQLRDLLLCFPQFQFQFQFLPIPFTMDCVVSGWSDKREKKGKYSTKINSNPGLPATRPGCVVSVWSFSRVLGQGRVEQSRVEQSRVGQGIRVGQGSVLWLWCHEQPCSFEFVLLLCACCCCCCCCCVLLRIVCAVAIARFSMFLSYVILYRTFILSDK